MPAVDTPPQQQNRSFPPPLRAGIGLIGAGVEKARNVNVVGLATLPLRGLGKIKVAHVRQTVGWAYGELTERGEALIDKVRGKDTTPAEPVPSPAEVAELVEQVTDPFGLPEEVAQAVEEATPGATLTHDQLPLEDYDHLTLGALRARLSRLDPVALVQLRDYERAHANRLPVLTMLENRIAKVGSATP